MSGRTAAFISLATSVVSYVLVSGLGVVLRLDESTTEFWAQLLSLLSGGMLITAWAWLKFQRVASRGEGSEPLWAVRSIDPSGVSLRHGLFSERFVLWSEVRDVRDVGVEVHLVLERDALRLEGVTKSSETAKRLRTAFASSRAAR